MYFPNSKKTKEREECQGVYLEEHNVPILQNKDRRQHVKVGVARHCSSGSDDPDAFLKSKNSSQPLPFSLLVLLLLPLMPPPHCWKVGYFLLFLHF